MLSAEVSGYAKRKTTKIGAVSQRISHKPHLHDSACIAKPDITGPIAGRQNQTAVHDDREIGISTREY
jgi:hypothetical protein